MRSGLVTRGIVDWVINGQALLLVETYYLYGGPTAVDISGIL